MILFSFIYYCIKHISSEALDLSIDYCHNRLTHFTLNLRYLPFLCHIERIPILAGLINVAANRLPSFTRLHSVSRAYRVWVLITCECLDVSLVALRTSSRCLYRCVLLLIFFYQFSPVDQYLCPLFRSSLVVFKCL